MASYKRKTVRISTENPQFDPIFSKLILILAFITSLMLGIAFQSFAVFLLVFFTIGLYFRIPLSDELFATSLNLLWSTAFGAFFWLITAMVEEVLELNTYYMPVIIPMVWSFMASMRRNKRPSHRPAPEESTEQAQ